MLTGPVIADKPRQHFGHHPHTQQTINKTSDPFRISYSALTARNTTLTHSFVPAYLARTLSYNPFARAVRKVGRAFELPTLDPLARPLVALPRAAPALVLAGPFPGSPEERYGLEPAPALPQLAHPRHALGGKYFRGTARRPPPRPHAHRVRRLLSRLSPSAVRTWARGRHSPPAPRPRPPRSFRTLGLPPTFGGALAHHRRLVRRYRYHQNQAYRLAEARAPSGYRYQQPYSTERIGVNGELILTNYPPIPYRRPLDFDSPRAALDNSLYYRALPADLPPFHPVLDLQRPRPHSYASRTRHAPVWEAPWPQGPGPLISSEEAFIARLAERFSTRFTAI